MDGSPHLDTCLPQAVALQYVSALRIIMLSSAATWHSAACDGVCEPLGSLPEPCSVQSWMTAVPQEAPSCQVTVHFQPACYPALLYLPEAPLLSTWVQNNKNHGTQDSQVVPHLGTD